MGCWCSDCDWSGGVNTEIIPVVVGGMVGGGNGDGVYNWAGYYDSNDRGWRIGA